MIKFKAIIQKAGKQGEKTGWTYIDIPVEIAQQVKPGNKKAFRAKGKLDKFSFKQVAIMPMGNGDFMMPLNKDMRKGTGKSKGHEVMVQMELDESEIVISEELMACLEDEPKALEAFNALSKGEKHYFNNSIVSAKTEPTRARRIAETVNAMLMGQKYGEMVRYLKLQKEKGLR